MSGSPYFDNEPDDELVGLDSRVAALIVRAAQGYLHGCRHFARHAIYQGVDGALDRIYTDDEEPDAAVERAAGDAELTRQAQDLKLIATYAKEVKFSSHGLSIEVTDRIEQTLRPALST